MDGLETFSDLVSEVYDAALDPGRWPSVLERTAGCTRGAACGLMVHDLSHHCASMTVSWGDDPGSSRRYCQDYARHSPIWGMVLSAMRTGGVVVSSRLLPWPEFSNSRFYLEWAKPQGYMDAVQAVLEAGSTTFASLAVIRHERDGLVDDATIARMRMLLPHFRRAVLVGRDLGQSRSKAADLVDALDTLSCAVFLVAADGSLRHSNLSGQQLAEEGAVVRTADGRLKAVDSRAQGALLNAVRAASENCLVGDTGVSLTLESGDGETYVATVLPLKSGRRRQLGESCDSVAAVFVHPAETELRPPPALGKHFGLTRAELRVLMAIVVHGHTQRAADALGIGQSTLKTHLSRVFSKTGVSRQSGLVKLVSGFSAPAFRGGRPTMIRG